MKALAAALAALSICVATEAAAAPPRPAELRVVGGEGWHAENSFTLTWSSPQPPPPAAVRYRLRDPLGTPIAAGGLTWPADGIGGLIVPEIPGSYTAEVWFEDAAGSEGPVAVAALRFDNSRPAAITPPAIPAWIGRTSFPLTVRLPHPPGPPPLSGIRGYAVVIDSAPGGAPCAAADRCSDAETTLRGGVGDDALRITTLPEGTSYLHAVAVSGSGMKSAISAHAALRVDTTDPVTRLSGTPAGWSNRAVRLTATAADSGSGMEPDGSGPPPITAIVVDGSVPTIAPGRTVTATVIEEGAHRVAYYARDAAGNTDDGGGSNGLDNRQPRTVTVRIDRGPPSIALANTQAPHDPELIRARFTDRLSGPDFSRGWIGVRAFGSGDPFDRLPAAPPGRGELRARWDSDAYPAGRYELRAVGYDIAGNAMTTTRRANGTAMVLDNPLKVPTSLRVSFAHHPPASRTVPYGRGVRVGGELSGSDPLVRMPVRIVERFAAGSGLATRVSTVLTGTDGGFYARLVPGPNRTVTASFDGSPTLGRSTGRSLRLRVRSRVRLRSSATAAEVGGPPLIFRGGVAAPRAGMPAGGLSVQLQFRLPGLRWSEFRTVQTDRRGRFRYAYRFSDDDSRGVRFQFRAYAPAQDGWPYEPGSSQPIAVRGR